MKKAIQRRAISKKAKPKFSERTIKNAISQSLKMEGISLRRALKNTALIKKLKQYA